MNLKKQIDKHIGEQTRSKLGNIEITKPKGINFKNKEISSNNLPNLIWTVRYYYFDRGSLFVPTYEKFEKYSDSIYQKNIISNDSGGFYEFGFEENINVQYSVAVFSNNDLRVTIPIECASNSGVALYKEEDGDVTQIFGGVSSNKKDITLFIKQGVWTKLYLYYYRQSSNGFIHAFNGIKDFISSWRITVFGIPNTPVWYDPPIETYSDPITGVTKNTLRWYLPEDSDWAGHTIYRKEAVEVNDFKEPIDSGNYPYGFVTTDLRDYQHGSKITIDSVTYTVQDTEVVYGNLIDNSNFEDANYEDNFIPHWTYRATSDQSVHTANCSASTSRGYHLYNGIGIVLNAPVTDNVSSSRTVFIESTAFTAVNTTLGYSLGFSTYYSGDSAIGVVGLRYYSSSDGSLCSTPQQTNDLMDSTVWATQVEQVFAYNQTYAGSEDFKLPHDCKYIKVRLYVSSGNSGTCTRYFDGIKISQYQPRFYYSVSTANYMLIKTQEQLTIPDTNRTVLRSKFINEATPYIYGGNTDSYNNPNFVKDDGLLSLNVGAINITSPSDVVTTNAFSSAYGLSKYLCNFIVTQNNTYPALFGSKVGLITATASTSHAYVSTVYHEAAYSGRYILSFYAKSNDVNSINYGMLHTAGGGTFKTSTVTSSWQRYRIIENVSGPSGTMGYRVGFSTAEGGKIAIDGLKLEKRVNTAYPTGFYDGRISGDQYVDYHGIKFDSTSEGVGKGSIRFYWYPSFNYTEPLSNTAPKRMPIVTLFSSGVGLSTANIHIGYYSITGPYYAMYLYSRNSGGNYNYISYEGVDFQNEEKVCVQATWNGSTAYLYVNGESSAGNTQFYPLHMCDSVRIGKKDNVIFSPASNSPADFMLSDLKIDDATLSDRAVLYDKNATGVSPSKSLNSKTIELTEWKNVGIRYRQGTDLNNPLKFNDVTVDPGDYYVYAIDVFTKDGNRSALSATAGIVTGDAIPPGDITGTGASQSILGSIKYSWTNPPDTDFAGCKVYMYDGGYVHVDDVQGFYSELNSYNLATSGSNVSTSIYVSTYDRLFNESSNKVRISGKTGAVDQYWIKLSSPNASKYNPNAYWYRDRDDGVNYGYSTYIYSNTHLDFYGASLGLKIYDGNKSVLEDFSDTTVTCLGVTETDGDNIWSYLATWDHGIINNEGTGTLLVKGVTSGAYVSEEFDIGIDITEPVLSAAHIKDGDGGSKQIIRVGLNSGVTDAFSGVAYIQMATDNTFTTQVQEYDYTEATSFSYVLPATVDSYNVYVRAYDKADNYSAAVDAGSYNFEGERISIDIKLVDDTLVPLSPINGWYKKTYSTPSGIAENFPNVLTKVAVGNHRVLRKIDWSLFRNDLDFAIAIGSIDSGFDTTTSHSFLNTTDASWRSGEFTYQVNVFTKGDSDNASHYIRYKRDHHKPIYSGDGFFTSDCRPRDRGTWLKFDTDGMIDPSSVKMQSGLWKLGIYRKIYGKDWSFGTPIATLSSAGELPDYFTDYEDNLEGYKKYHYAAILHDYADNTVTGIGPIILMTPDWEFTYRNKINNSSFELYEGDLSGGQSDVEVESWVMNDDYKIATNTVLFGAQNGGVIVDGDTIYTKVFLPQYNSSRKWIISCYGTSEAGGEIQYIGFRFINFDGSTADTTSYSSMSNSGYVYDKNGNSWERFKYTLDGSGFDVDQQGATLLHVIFPSIVQGTMYLDGVQMERATATQTGPTNFISNRVLTTDRFEASYIYGNMIEAKQIHGGHIQANGLEVYNDDAIGMTQILVGTKQSRIDNSDAVNDAFTKLDQQSLVFHDVGNSIDRFYGFAKHIEIGATAFSDGWVYYSTAFKDYSGNRINPHLIIQPVRYQSYSADNPNSQTVEFNVEQDNSIEYKGKRFKAQYYLRDGLFGYNLDTIPSNQLTYNTIKHKQLESFSDDSAGGVSNGVSTAENIELDFSIQWRDISEEDKETHIAKVSVWSQKYGNHGSDYECVASSLFTAPSHVIGLVNGYKLNINDEDAKGASDFRVRWDFRQDQPNSNTDPVTMYWNSINYATAIGSIVTTANSINASYRWLAIDGGLS